MSEFERSLVHSFNKFFKGESQIKGIAYRRKQSRFTQQVLDVLVDSPDLKFYLGIECKSISIKKGANKLYFSQHFSNRQIERTTFFLNKSGRKGYLAVEIKRGRGKSKKAYMIDWGIIEDRYSKNQKGLSIKEIKSVGKEIDRISGWYDISSCF